MHQWKRIGTCEQKRGSALNDHLNSLQPLKKLCKAITTNDEECESILLLMSIWNATECRNISMRRKSNSKLNFHVVDENFFNFPLLLPSIILLSKFISGQQKCFEFKYLEQFEINSMRTECEGNSWTSEMWLESYRVIEEQNWISMRLQNSDAFSANNFPASFMSIIFVPSGNPAEWCDIMFVSTNCYPSGGGRARTIIITVHDVSESGETESPKFNQTTANALNDKNVLIKVPSLCLKCHCHG